MSDLQALIKTVLSFEVATDIDFFELTEFAGYKPETIFLSVMSKVKTMTDQRLLQYAIVFGLLRGFGGNKDWKTLEERTSSAVGKKMLADARTKFMIVLDKKKLGNVTFDRIMGAFPSLTFKIWQMICSKGRGNSKLPTYSGDLPEKFRYPGSPAAMSAESWASHRDHYVEWSAQIQTLWKVPNIDRGEILKFAELQYHNELYPMSERRDY